MGRSQREKGAQFERDVAKIFSAFVGREVRRHLGQARDGGEDIIVPPLTVECKRRKSLKTIMSWYEQARAASRKIGNAPIPVVVMREDSGETMVLMSLTDFLSVADRTFFE